MLDKITGYRYNSLRLPIRSAMTILDQITTPRHFCAGPPERNKITGYRYNSLRLPIRSAMTILDQITTPVIPAQAGILMLGKITGYRYN
ncbi:hypothetical protein WG906_01050 [Pedobacter sp. P351]|uniref:hypothetical protein n=1 Tax=Pedobacter superstes TaxID=3133441 RepID=UPI0030B3B376